MYLFILWVFVNIVFYFRRMLVFGGFFLRNNFEFLYYCKGKNVVFVILCLDLNLVKFKGKWCFVVIIGYLLIFRIIFE